MNKKNLKRLYKLNDQDLLQEVHFPVQVIFNDQFEDDFLDAVINYISKGHGLGAEYGACVFPDDLDDYDIATRGTFDGVEFGLHSGTEVILDYKTFYYYLNLVCQRYLEDYPGDRGAMESALAEFRSRYQI